MFPLAGLFSPGCCLTDTFRPFRCSLSIADPPPCCDCLQRYAPQHAVTCWYYLSSFINYKESSDSPNIALWKVHTHPEAGRRWQHMPVCPPPRRCHLPVLWSWCTALPASWLVLFGLRTGVPAQACSWPQHLRREAGCHGVLVETAFQVTHSLVRFCSLGNYGYPRSLLFVSSSPLFSLCIHLDRSLSVPRRTRVDAVGSGGRGTFQHFGLAVAG